MSAPTNPAAKADTKREVDGSESNAQPAALDRSVRIRPSAMMPAPEPSAAAASAAASSVAVTPAPLSLLRLAVVERQLIMQSLDLFSLARLASTCRQLRAEAMHREAGKFIPEPEAESALSDLCFVSRSSVAHASPLFRAHAPVLLDFDTDAGTEMPPAQQQELIIKASRFSRITELSVGNNRWTKSQALQLLARPWIQSVNRVYLQSRSPVWLRSSAVQHALFALPQLTSLWLVPASNLEACGLRASALSRTSKLTHVRVYLQQAGGAQMLRAMRTAPALRTVELVSVDDAIPIGPLIWCLPPTLTELRLSGFSLEPESTSRSALKTMFTRLPLLQCLFATRMQIAPLLQGMLDAGVSALPNLRRVEFETGIADGLEDDLMRRFLHKFPSVIVRFDYRDATQDDDAVAAIAIARRFGAWPRVELDLYRANPPPSPHASDDEDGSDVEDLADPGLDADERGH